MIQQYGFTKYMGKKKPTFRSSWEKAYALALETSPTVKAWDSEPYGISYFNVVTKKHQMYWPDFLVVFSNGFILVVEIKPGKEAISEMAKSTYDKLMLAQNMSKWMAAVAFVQNKYGKDKSGFKVYTEKDLAKILRKNTTTKTKTTKTAVKTRGTKR